MEYTLSGGGQVLKSVQHFQMTFRGGAITYDMTKDFNNAGAPVTVSRPAFAR